MIDSSLVRVDCRQKNNGVKKLHFIIAVLEERAPHSTGQMLCNQDLRESGPASDACLPSVLQVLSRFEIVPDSRFHTVSDLSVSCLLGSL
jgi:hypothetical protein